MADKSPKAPGFYWLAIDDELRFVDERVFLVRVTSEKRKAGYVEEFEYLLTQIEFLDSDWGPIMVEDKGFEAIADGTTHRIGRDASIGGFRTGTHHELVRLNWLGHVKQPKLPAEVRPFEGALA